MEEVTIDRAMQIAAEYYQAGRLEERRSACAGRFWRCSRGMPVRLNLLGTLSYHAGYNDVAIELIRRAVAIDPAVSAYQSNFGNLLRVTGHVDDAIAAYQASLPLTPDMGEIYSNLASATGRKGATWRQRIASIHRNDELIPNWLECTYSNLGNFALTDQGRVRRRR